ncbi:nicotinate phosphoribosyltransferase family-domain-containing protein [Gamsiella multidivaricata]|uniref:nicotinate phosphoribosyltransferase family-domain-containing protein n=1 Tax=Gamsiella multidivaricata TaxID=101098 RepID=UPI00221FA21B|nr:nicotinate phosphoribosyltransferase family-domain-containing protein [Gamsiella multidivaricata]KAI7829479.1 nicotinate phosphoribosyltransferase family-domain-containing protein [Gamsiella multidivaricata]
MMAFNIPMAVLTDSYKTTHPFIYPKAQKMVAYAEMRQAYDKDPHDNRIVFYGIRFIIENYVSKKWTMQDIEQAEVFFATHNAGFMPFPFPKDLFVKIVKEHDGYFPVKIEALPDGTACHTHVPTYQITAEGDMSRLVTFLETLLTMIWYPTTVATLSRRSRDLIQAAYDKSVDADSFWSLESRLHDFGFRACTNVEQSVIGGTAHLLNFTGTDTLSAAYYAQFQLNKGEPVASSIPASEHSVMMAFRTEKEAMEAMIEHFGEGVFACVMDSYDYQRALDSVLPAVASFKLEKGGFLVLRPDSGDIIESVLQGLRAAEKVFGVDVNQKGYKVIRGCGVIQGDGVTFKSLSQILDAVLAEGFAAQNCAFGMGGGLLQKLNRDTLSFATKLSHIVYADGTRRDIMKHPKTDSEKTSLPGIFDVIRNDQGIPMVYPRAEDGIPHKDNLLQVVYDHGKVPLAATGTTSSLFAPSVTPSMATEEDRILSSAGSLHAWPVFSELKGRVQKEWENLPKVFDPISKELREKIKVVLAAGEP